MQLRFRGTQKTEEVCNRRKETPGTEGGGREAERGRARASGSSGILGTRCGVWLGRGDVRRQEKESGGDMPGHF